MSVNVPLRTVASLVACAAVIVTAGGILHAQEGRGAIVGRVVDQTGAAVPSAKVTVVNKAMGTRFEQAANETGYYQATFLIPGVYTVEVELTGFKKAVRDNIEVRVNDRLEVNVPIEVGNTEQSITVTGETPLLQTATASSGTVVDMRRVQDLPTPHGNPFFLIGTAAGVAFSRDARLDRPFEPTHIAGYTIDGTRANRSDITIDGVPATATANANEVTATYVPPSDILQEFKVQTATFDAAFGQTEGGVTNMVIKSGTNDLHGTAYYNKMIPSWFANDFVANKKGEPRSDFTYNRWGGSLGGPVWIPKIYNGRNRTFFEWGYEGIKESRPRNNGTPTVPTAKMKQGDFSEVPTPIYNPFTRVRQPNGTFIAQPFRNNIIPPELINPVGVNILKYFPDPLTSGIINNYAQPNLMENAKYFSVTGRLDHNLTDRQRLYGRVSWYDRNSDYNNYFHNLATGNWFQFFSRNAVLDHVFTITPTTVTNVRYGYNRFVRVTMGNPEAQGFDLTSLGFPASYNNSIPADVRQFPRIDLAGAQGTAIGGESRPIDTHAIIGSVQKSQGAHFLKFGTEFRAYRENSVPFGNDMTGRFNFDSGWTKGPASNAGTPANQMPYSVAALLLGLPSDSNTFVARNASYAEQSTSWGFFVQDDWKVSRRLTLNLGLRWEFEGAMTERYDRSVKGFNYTAVPSFAATAETRYAQLTNPPLPVSQFKVRGGLTFAGADGSNLYNTPKNILLPRFGFAYQVTNNMVVRGGYGMFAGFLGQRRGDVVQSGFSQNTNISPTSDGGATFTPILSNPFPTILEPSGASLGYNTFGGQGITFFNQNPDVPIMQRWQIGFQREFMQSFVIDVTYVGNRGTRIEMVRELNGTPRQYMSTMDWARDTAKIAELGSTTVNNPYLDLLPGAVGAFRGTKIAPERLLRPYSQFDTVKTTTNQGYSWYHGLQVSAEKRFSKGFTLAGNYTFSKFMEAIEYLNVTDPMPYEVISDFDVPHRVNISGIWELPFGRNKALFTNIHPAANVFIGGWQLSGVYTFQSGAPISFQASGGNPTGTTPPGSVAFVGDIHDLIRPSDQRSIERWFNTTGFATGSANMDINRQLRTFPLRFGFLRSDQVNNWDLSLVKNTRIRERYNIQFKGEFLNAFNHPLLPVPVGDPGNANFGTMLNASNQANYPRRVQLTLKFLF